MTSVRSRFRLCLFGFAIAGAAAMAHAKARIHKHVNFLADHGAKAGSHDIGNDIRTEERTSAEG